MPVSKLTLQFTQNATAIEGSETVYRDTEVTGFSLKVTPSQNKIFFYQYRMGGRAGYSRKIKIGKFPAIKPDDARKIAIQYAAEVARKADPQERLKKEISTRISSQQNSFKKIFDKYCEEQLNQNRTGNDVKAIFEREFLPTLGNTAITAIDRRDISKILNHILAEGKGYAANRALSNTKTFFRWMVSEGYLQADPTSVMQKPFKGEKSRDRVLSPSELKNIWDQFDLLDCKPFGDALKLLVLTGQRRTEVGSMRWDDLDLDSGVWDMPGEITKNKQRHKLPLGTTALEIIKAQKLIFVRDKKTGKKVPCPYVFSTTGETPISGWSKIKGQIVEYLNSKKIKIKDWRYHDFRRTVSTGLGDLGYGDEDIKIVLNHGGRGVTAIYNRSEYINKKREMLETWETKLINILC